jgi:hypothetical protein
MFSKSLYIKNYLYPTKNLLRRSGWNIYISILSGRGYLKGRKITFIRQQNFIMMVLIAFV